MSTDRTWKIGDWLEFRDERQFVYRVDDLLVHFVSKDGDPDHSMDDSRELTHLPDCTGWEWEPPKPIDPPEGYRLITEGEVILAGDMFLDGEWGFLHPESHPGGKKWNAKLYLPYARKIEPKYRPFANAAEFAPHRDRWVRWKASIGTANDSLVHRIHSYSDSVVFIGCATTGMFWKEAFEELEFEDASPFGVKE